MTDEMNISRWATDLHFPQGWALGWYRVHKAFAGKITFVAMSDQSVLPSSRTVPDHHPVHPLTLRPAALSLQKWTTQLHTHQPHLQGC